MKPTTLFTFPSARHQPSYRYRVEQFLPHWGNYGISVHLANPVIPSLMRQWVAAISAGTYDFFLLQKKLLHPWVISFISKRTRLIYDFDDALFARESFRNTNPAGLQPGSPSAIKRLDHILRNSHIVFAGNRFLKEYAARFTANIHVVPTCLPIPVVNTSPHTRNPGAITIGWIGSSKNLWYLADIDAALRLIQNEFPFVTFALMCDRQPTAMQTRWELTPWSSEGESAWLQSLDIGIMPLSSDDWSRGKCAFKLLQYMSYAKPVVGSRIGANCEAIDDGKNGYLPETSKGWYDALKRLILDKESRNRMGRKSRAIFTERFELSLAQGIMAKAITEGIKR